MFAYISIVLCMILYPAMYAAVIYWIRELFEKEENKKRIPFSDKREFVVLLLGEIALVRIWFSLGRCDLFHLTFELLYFMLIAISILCMTDFWERIVPNRILLIWLFVFILTMGWQGVRNIDPVIEILPSVVLGFVFCLISFGLGYILSHGSMGAGDVKLSFLMGLFLTGQYVVGAILYGCIAAAIYSIVQLIRKKVTKKDKLPFVPFLFIGLIIRYLVG